MLEKNNRPTKRKREEQHNSTIVPSSKAESVNPGLWDILLALIKSVWSLFWRALPD